MALEPATVKSVASGNVKSIAKDISAYYRENPNAGDTVEGIASWWITSQRLKDSKNMVKNALEYLVNQGELDRKVFNGREIYVRST
jgi:hypothetical protein